jgi:hypothetical protein
MLEELESLKAHIDAKFDHHNELDKVRALRINEILEAQKDVASKNEATIIRAHSRIDEVSLKHSTLETKIKTVQGVGATVGATLAALGAWVGLTTK